MSLPQRKSPRKQGYDYAQSGMYFVTICTHQRERLFGYIRDGEMHRNLLGKITAECWAAIPRHHPHVELDVYVIMPNHVHGIIVITDVVGTPYMVSENNLKSNQTDGMYPVPTNTNSHESVNPKPVLGVVVGTFKAAVTRHANRILSLPTTVWQARYHDRIIRNEREYNYIRQYVLANPARWQEDTFYQLK